MAISFEQTLIDVWRQVLVEKAKVVVLGTEHYPVRLTPKELTYGGDAIAYNDREVTLNCCRYFWLNVNVSCPVG